jgi:hypothetical protein
MALMPAFEVDHAEPGIATIWLAVYVPALVAIAKTWADDPRSAHVFDARSTQPAAC